MSACLVIIFIVWHKSRVCFWQIRPSPPATHQIFNTFPFYSIFTSIPYTQRRGKEKKHTHIFHVNIIHRSSSLAKERFPYFVFTLNIMKIQEQFWNWRFFIARAFKEICCRFFFACFWVGEVTFPHGSWCRKVDLLFSIMYIFTLTFFLSLFNSLMWTSHSMTSLFSSSIRLTTLPENFDSETFSSISLYNAVV